MPNSLVSIHVDGDQPKPKEGPTKCSMTTGGFVLQRVAKENKTRRTWQIRSKVRIPQKKINANVPMLYNNMCRRPPTTERPARDPLTPNDVAALFLVGVELAPDPVPVDVPDPEVLEPDAPLQWKLPWITLPFPLSAEKPLHVSGDSDVRLNAPLTSVRSGNEGVVKFPAMVIAPPTVDNAGKLTELRSGLLVTVRAPPILERIGNERLASSELASKIKLPIPVANDPTVVKLGAA